MHVIRPVRRDDLPGLLALAKVTSFGLTTLPDDPELLEQRIDASTVGFEQLRGKPAGEPYLFVLEDLSTGAVTGTTGVVSKVGGFEPFYAYRIETSVHESQQLGVRREVRTLHLVEEHDGPCEIGSLFLSPEVRTKGLGRLLSLSRFVFMAEFRPFFDPVVIAELRGVIDDRGHSPFWDALGSHFFQIEFPKAAYLSIKNKRFIADLMPGHPIYIPLLPESAQRVIGQVHEQTKPALHILESEGFAFSGMVDIFEAGPIVQCRLDDIRTVRASMRAEVAAVDDGITDEPASIIGTTLRQFRACLGSVRDQGNGRVALSRLTALALQVKVGDMVRHVPLRPAAEGRPASQTRGTS